MSQVQGKRLPCCQGKKRGERVYRPTTISTTNTNPKHPSDDSGFTDTSLDGPNEPPPVDGNLNFPGSAVSSLSDAQDAADDVSDGDGQAALDASSAPRK